MSDFLMDLAFRDFVMWSFDDRRAQFEADTGLRLPPAVTVLDQLIDEATGALSNYLDEFVAWCRVDWEGES